MNTVKAQCTVNISNVSITKRSGPDADPLGCKYVFDASFDIKANNGFKFLFFHSWKTEDYVNSFNCPANGQTPAKDPPTSLTLGTAVNDLGKSFMDFGFVNLPAPSSVSTTPVDITGNIATTYPNDGSVILTQVSNSLGMTATVNRKGTTDTLHFVVTNITVYLAGACEPFSATTDIWGSNTNSGTPSAQCYICGRLQTIDNPGVAVTKTCAGSLTPTNDYTVSLTNGPTQTLHLTYRVYVDVNDNGLKEPGIDPLIYTSPLITLNPNQDVDFGPGPLPWPYCCIGPWGYYGIYVVVDIQEFTNDLESQIIETGCATLPIKLRSFEADRNKSNVDLKWITEIEDNNKGFYVERKLSNGGWEQITFVASQATNGNSSSPLTYVLTDFNNTKGISQYRLRQVDMDGKQAYSQIRSVRGEGQKSNTIIYPNPSGDGKVNIVFEGVNSIRDVSLMDVSGKTLKQWKGVTNNNIHIDNLNAGFYTVRIVNTETGEQVVEKFIVNKR